MANNSMVNGVVFGWINVRFNLFGVPLIGIKDIAYNKKQAKENVFGAGADAIGRGHGRKDANGSITVLLEEWRQIISAAPNKDVLDISPFDVPVTFGDSQATAITDVLKSVEFLENPRNIKEGDMSIWITIPIIIGDIEYGG